ncbi:MULTISPECIES: helix-turn-helix domain-containing protein [Reichenbachiella]|uniref:DNA-binding transcriptional regulator, XRE family n=1 Tax=Reichenbachiella agariperforans TaxID=156994 RepID=A0A1M6LMR2_REIAG|nr:MULTISPECIES: helix-turn-helix domain-containing protein [Reichenbachiella]MBU2913985.1 helix-turn-helix transcriptional regulator [Reichenbachiella agariperforans]RJE74106.1 hypothetical protein BGP76_12990 [Reichenbachiella sp. MSK19-1]SHJ72509.1 DNA-binding transcriptional regulator, XRE family [Reichenbachiella agariperforans]
MLKLNIDYLTRLRGISKNFTYLTKLGLSYNISQRLSTGNVKSINLGHLEKICLDLRCTPNDLLEWHADQSVSSDHPLHTLVRDPRLLESLEKIQNLPLDKFKRLNDLIDNLE